MGTSRVPLSEGGWGSDSIEECVCFGECVGVRGSAWECVGMRGDPKSY
jgi:hypothetical protein